MQHEPVQAGAKAAQRHAVGAGQRQPCGVRVTRGEHHVRVQDRKQPAHGAGGFPAQREHNGVITGHRIEHPHPDQLGGGEHVANRADPGHADQPVSVGLTRGVVEPSGSPRMT